MADAVTASWIQRPILWGSAGLCLVVAWFFADATFGGGALFVQDVMVQNVPFRFYLHDALGRGELPLWVPQISAGFPLFAEGQVGALYPPNLLFALFLSPWQAVNASIVGHLMLAAVAMALFVRHLHSGVSGALTAGLTYGLSGYLVVRAMSPNFLAVAAWSPLLFLCVDAAITTDRRRPLLWATAILALQLLAGHPQATAYTAVAVLIYAALRTRRRSLMRVVWVGFAISGGLWLAAVQVLPTLELMQPSARAGGLGFERFVQMSMAPERLLTLLLPSLLGDSSYGTYWGGAGDFFIQMCPYLGVLALPLCWLALSERREAPTFALGVIAIAGLILSMGKFTGLFEILYQVPVMRPLRIPTRFLLWWAMAGSALVGLGADRLLNGPVRRRQWLASAVLLGLCLASCMLTIGALPSVQVAADLTSADVARMGLWRSRLIGEAVRAATLLVLLALLVISGRWRRHVLGRRLVAVVLPIVVVADLSGFGRGFNAVIDAAVYEMAPATAVAIQRHHEQTGAPDALAGAARFRIASVVTEANTGADRHAGWRHDTQPYQVYPEALRHYTGGMFGLANALPGWSPLHLAQHRDLADNSPAILDLASVAYIVAPRSDLSDAVVTDASGTDVYLPSMPTSSVVVRKVADWLPRAYVVTEAIVVEDRAIRLRALESAFDPTRRVLLSAGESLRQTEGRAIAARISTYEPTHVEVELPTREGDAYLVLTDADYPGWTATVDGEAVPIETANHMFRGVPLTPTAQRVEFDYDPASFRLGMWLSVAGLICWIWLFRQTREHDQVGEHVLASAQPKLAAVESPICSRAWLIQGALIFILYGLAMRTDAWLAWSTRLNVQALLGSQ
ncbi:MAG: YfhO family protein [Gemmatimonadetes bacterium]|nr:YfhO family protein [Gemmatimonadota bacterium]